MSKIFITGPDTEIGKTFISSWLCLHFRFEYFKPIQTEPKVDHDAPEVAISKSVEFMIRAIHIISWPLIAIWKYIHVEYYTSRLETSPFSTKSQWKCA